MKIFAWLTLLPACAGLAADLLPPGEGRQVRFSWDAERAYTVLARPGSVTDLQLAEDEQIEAMALGDTAQWSVAQVPGHLFLKPLRSGLLTSGTLVTSRRTYQLTLRAGAENGAWYQKVAWADPRLDLIRGAAGSMAATATPGGAKGVAAPDTGSRLGNLQFAYRVEGKAPFRPTQVYDDGQFLYLRFSAGIQELPAVFVGGEDGGLELANYLVRPDGITVQRLAPRLVLRLGRQEVQIQRLADEAVRGRP